MDFAEIKNKSVKELTELLAEKRAELASLRFRAHGRELKQTHKVSETRRAVARVLTVLAWKKASKA